jgi:NADH dehydrogenase I D subunit
MHNVLTENKEKKLETRVLHINMGPQHPSTHGVLRLILTLDGETVVKCTPDIGYLHRGMEKLAEHRTYLQNITLTDRLDYVAAMSNNIGYCVAVESLFNIDVPVRAEYIRTILAEMSRISNHLLWLATHALDIGAMTVFLYCFRERETLLDLFEQLTGARLTVSFPRIGGVRNDLSDGWIDTLLTFTEEFPSRIEEYETLIDQNRIWLNRTKGIGVIPAEEAINLGLSGPVLRGSGINYDVRRAMPYGVYDQIEWNVPVGKNGDVYDRYRCRMEEMRQSNLIIRQCCEKIPFGPVLTESPKFVLPPKDKIFSDMEHLIRQFELIVKGPMGIPKGDIYSATESPKGELGFYIVSNGTGKPYRLKVRAPSFVHVSALPRLCEGGFIADVIANIGTIDIVLGEVDR